MDYGTRKIIHIDMDCFYAAVELKHRPELKGRPVAIGGPVESRSVLCTSNYEARKYGVRAAMSSRRAVQLCPDLILIPPHFELYKEESQKVREIFARFTSKIEPLSLDEAYKLTKYLERQKIIIRDDNDGGFQIPIPDEDTLSKLQATSVTYRFATGKSKGKKAMVLKSVTDNDHTATKGLVTKNSGFSLHAGVATKAHERDRLEKVCRYIARPAVSEERLSINDQGDVIYKFKKPWDDGTTAMKLTPMELMERLVALVPRPRVHLTRYHGVLGPHYKHRKQIVPKPPELKVTGQEQDIIDPKQLELKKKNIPWARLLARVFNIDVETCIKCGGKMKIIAAIEDPKVIRKILEHMGLDTKPPRLMPARGPPKVQHHFEDDLAQQHFDMNFDNFNQSAD